MAYFDLNTQKVIKELPRTHNGKTFYDTLSKEVHIEHGFLEITDERPKDVNYETHKVVKGELEILSNKAIQHYSVVALTEAELRERYEANTPFTIKPAQGRKQLRVMGLFDAVQNHITDSNDIDLIDFWEYATEWNLDSSTIQSMAEMLQIDKYQFFNEAEKYKL